MTRATASQSQRLAAVQAPVIPIIARWIAETPGTIALGQGLVSYPPPPEAVEAARRFGTSLEDHHYGPIEGLPSLVGALEDKLARENGIAVRPASRVVVTAGANLAFMNAVLAVTDPGDEVILPVPFYFNHEMAVTMAGARPVAVRSTDRDQLDVEAIAAAITPRTRAVATVSPNNPTGAVYPESDLRRVNALCREHGLFHVHDETYEYFVYGPERHFSPGAIDGAADHTITLFSLSKAYGLASWRVGYMVIPESLWEAIDKIQDTMVICAPSVSQHAALAAVACGRPYTERQLGPLRAARAIMQRELGRASQVCEVPPAAGAFYFFVRVFTSMDSLVLTERLIREHGVAVVPGRVFGESSCAIRVSYGVTDAATAEEGARRLADGLLAMVRP
ncbi:MAG: pyridoxal phosphate-dependent aminotransferase [Acidobacteria bacterium]|nr:pyridoxal phosphate-dependent aminotransferase [Acidobacteriota bacterium]